MTSGRFVLWCLAALLFVGQALGAPPDNSSLSASELIFRLIPESRWTEPVGWPQKALSEGKVLLYRRGAYEPEVELDVNEVGRLPLGEWFWIGQAPGYASVGSGIIQLAEPLTAPKAMNWPVTPACRIELQEVGQDTAGWHQVDRVDLVSLTHGAAYPLQPSQRDAFWIPAGPWLSYTVGPAGLQAISRPGYCSADEQVELRRPEAPERGSQDLLLHVRLPPDYEKAAFETLTVALQRADRRQADTLAPTAVGISKQQASFFFLDVPTDGPWRLELRHPEFRSVQHDVESLDGSVRELATVTLQPRKTLRFSVDYRPARDHEKETLEVRHCGLARALLPGSFDRCQKLEVELALQEGLHDYVVPNLDDGRHIVTAVVEDRQLHGLGVGFFPYLDPAEDQAPLSEVIPLVEFEVYGSLLMRGEPVAGEVRLQSLEQEWRFPTDDELLYHLYYFGRKPVGDAVTVLADLEPQEQLGLYGGYGLALAACTDEGYCRQFHPHSWLRGAGRLDLEMGARRELALRVIDRDTGVPVQRAEVYFPSPSIALHFDAGEARWQESPAREPIVQLTDAQGHARLRHLPAGEIDFTVNKEGYELYRGKAYLGVAGRIDVEAPLQPEGEGKSVVLELADGRPAARAWLLVVDERGARFSTCARTTDSFGGVELPEDCLTDTRIVVFHPDAELRVVDATEPRATGRIVLPARDVRAPRLQLLGSDLRPLAGATLEILYDGVRIGPNELLAAASHAGFMPFYAADEGGILELPNITPGAVESVRVFSPFRSALVSVPQLSRSGITELILSAP